MSTGDVLRDPMFQLNLALWLLLPTPLQSNVRPILREAELELESLSRELPVPIPDRPAIAAALRTNDPPSAPAPDVLTQHRDQPGYLAIECKGASFGTGSSNARQAAGLLAVLRDLGPALGSSTGPQPGTLAYLTAADDHVAMHATLADLSEALHQQGVRTAPFGALGVERRADGLYLKLAEGSGLPPALSTACSSEPRVVEVGADDDPRPLYLIPWDPSVEQAPDERAFCQNVLFARLAAEAVSVIGRAPVPGRVQLDVDDLLTAATFGVYPRWRSKGDVRQVQRESRRYLVEAMQPIDGVDVTTAGQTRLECEIADDDARLKAIDALERRESPAPGTDTGLEQMSMFDESEGPADLGMA